MKGKKRLGNQEINEKLDILLKQHKQMLQNEQELEASQKHIDQDEEKELTEIEKLEKLEEEIIEQTQTHPLRKISYRDIAKGTVGAFFGVAAHYTFYYGIELTEKGLDVVRASLLYLLSFLIGFVFLYVTGFRKVKDPKLLVFLPIRLMTLYIISIIVSITILILFNQLQKDFWHNYILISAVALPAIIGACTADLIGKD